MKALESHYHADSEVSQNADYWMFDRNSLDITLLCFTKVVTVFSS